MCLGVLVVNKHGCYAIVAKAGQFVKRPGFFVLSASYAFVDLRFRRDIAARASSARSLANAAVAEDAMADRAGRPRPARLYF